MNKNIEGQLSFFSVDMNNDPVEQLQKQCNERKVKLIVLDRDKPKELTGRSECPTCNQHLSLIIRPNYQYCYRCGQLLKIDKKNIDEIELLKGG